MKTAYLAFLAVVSLSTPHTKGTEEPLIVNIAPVTAGSNSIAARGKGFEVSRREMDQVLATAIAKNPDDKLPPDAELRVLTHLIEIRLVFQQATDAEKAEGRKKTDADFPNIVKTLGEAEFQRRLTATGMTAGELRLMLFQDSTAQASLTRQLGINITDTEAKKYFDEHPGVFDQPEKAHIRELLLLTTVGYSSDSLPDAVIQAKHKQIFELRERVRRGEDFTALARRCDEDFMSRDSGGEYTFSRNQVEMETGDLAFSMKPGDISDVITNEDGFLFFQLLEIIPAQKGEFADISGKIKRVLAGARKQRLAPAYIRQLWRDANVEILDPRLRTEWLASDADAEKAARAAAQITSTNWPSAKP
jgi:hypothetical protein